MRRACTHAPGAIVLMAAPLSSSSATPCDARGYIAGLRLYGEQRQLLGWRFRNLSLVADAFNLPARSAPRRKKTQGKTQRANSRDFMEFLLVPRQGGKLAFSDWSIDICNVKRKHLPRMRSINMLTILY